MRLSFVKLILVFEREATEEVAYSYSSKSERGFYPASLVQAQVTVHGLCISHQCRFYRITSTKLFAIQTILPFCIHAICVNYSLKALWHLPNYASNLCIVESWFRKVKAALDYLFIHWLNPCRTKPCVTPHVQLFEPVRSINGVTMGGVTLNG